MELELGGGWEYHVDWESRDGKGEGEGEAEARAESTRKGEDEPDITALPDTTVVLLIIVHDDIV